MGRHKRFLSPSSGEVLRRGRISGRLRDNHRVPRRFEAPTRQTILPRTACGESGSDLQIGIRIR